MFPKVNHKFQKYFEPAIKTKSLWRLLIGVLVLIAIYACFLFLLFAGVGFYVGISSEVNGVVSDQTVRDEIEAFMQGQSPTSVIILLFSFFGMFFGVWLTIKFVHKRGFRSLLGPNLSDVFRHIKNGFFFLSILSLIGISIFAFIDPPNSNLPLSIWLKWMLFCIPLLFVQILSEELVFRGYLQQQLAARFNSRWAWFFLPSILFGLGHYDAQTMGSNAWLVVAHTTLFGMIAAEVTARTGNLGGAIGMHFANNLFALTIVTLDGAPASGLGLYTTAMHVSNEQAVRSVLIIDFIFVAVLYAGFLVWCKKRPQM